MDSESNSIGTNPDEESFMLLNGEENNSNSHSTDREIIRDEDTRSELKFDEG